MLICSRRKEAKRRKRHERPPPPAGTPVNEYVEVKETQQRKSLRRQEGIKGFKLKSAGTFEIVTEWHFLFYSTLYLTFRLVFVLLFVQVTHIMMHRQTCTRSSKVTNATTTWGKPTGDRKRPYRWKSCRMLCFNLSFETSWTSSLR